MNSPYPGKYTWIIHFSKYLPSVGVTVQDHFHTTNDMVDFHVASLQSNKDISNVRALNLLEI